MSLTLKDSSYHKIASAKDLEATSSVDSMAKNETDDTLSDKSRSNDDSFTSSKQDLEGCTVMKGEILKFSRPCISTNVFKKL